MKEEKYDVPDEKGDNGAEDAVNSDAPPSTQLGIITHPSRGEGQRPAVMTSKDVETMLSASTVMQAMMAELRRLREDGKDDRQHITQLSDTVASLRDALSQRSSSGSDRSSSGVTTSSSTASTEQRSSSTGEVSSSSSSISVSVMDNVKINERVIKALHNFGKWDPAPLDRSKAERLNVFLDRYEATVPAADGSGTHMLKFIGPHLLQTAFKWWKEEWTPKANSTFDSLSPVLGRLQESFPQELSADVIRFRSPHSAS